MTMTADRADSSFKLNPQDELNDLRMSAKALPLLDHVKRFIRDVVEPMSEEFHRLGQGNPDIWKPPRTRPRPRACGTSSCPMPRPAKACPTSTTPISRSSWARTAWRRKR